MERDPMEQADLYGRFVHRSGLAENTAAVYERRARQFLEFIAAEPDLYGDALHDEHVRDFAVKAWRRRLLTSDKYLPSTVQQHMTALGSFYDWLGLGKPDGIGVDVPKAKKEGLPEDDLRKLMLAARREGPRPLALVATMTYAGLRVGELAALDVDDVALTERTGQLSVRYGKGGAPRTLPVSGALRGALRDWLDERPGDRHEGPLWPTAKGRMAVRTIQDSVGRIGRSVGVDAHPHTLRHTFGRRLHEAGVPLPDAQVLMGHRSIATTAGYGNASRLDLERAVDRITLDD